MFDSASPSFMPHTVGIRITRITGSCLEAGSVAKEMLCEDGKQKTRAMVTAIYNKFFVHTPMR